MKQPMYRTYKNPSLFSNVETAVKELDVPQSSVYKLMRESGFPIPKIGKGIVMPKKQFFQRKSEPS